MTDNPSQRTYCSQLNPNENMLGTVDQVDVWLLLEYRPVWHAKAIAESDFSPTVRQWLDDTIADLAALGLKARPQLIRQPERDVLETRLLIAYGGILWKFQGVGYDFLSEISATEIVQTKPEDNQIAITQYFVCTNGRRDLCCSRFGLQTYRALREAVGERAWQVSHLGGHRFAPNVLTLPNGVMYGRVEETEVPSFVVDTLPGHIDFAHLRGRSSYPQVIQAAEGVAAQQNLTLLHVDGDDVSFAGRSGKTKVVVRRQGQGVAVLASCGDTQEQVVYPFAGAVIDESTATTEAE